MQDAGQYWNSVEAFERRKDAQLAMPIDIALPHELSLQQNVWLAQDYVRENFTRKGYVVLAAIHPPDHDNRNIHLHLLVSLRKVEGVGFAKSKAEQQDNYRNRDEYVEKLRASWEHLGNRHLARHGIDARIDRRSLKEQGIEREPQEHRGPVKSAAAFAEHDRKTAAAMKAEIAKLEAQIISIDAKRAEHDRRAARQVKHGAGPTTPAPVIDFNGSSKRKKKMAVEREDATDPKVQKQQIEDQQDLAARAQAQTELSARFLSAIQRDQQAAEKLREAELATVRTTSPEDDIADARRRYLKAAEDFDIRRPYASLSEIAGIEGAAFQREQEQLSQEAAKQTDPDKRELIDLRRQIEANDYMAITSRRLSEMSKVITGNDNSEESQRQQHRADYFAAEALELRRQRQELQEQINQRAGDELQQRVDNAREGRAGGSSSTGAAAEQDNSQPTKDLSQTPAAPRATEPERPAEVIFMSPNVPREPERAATVESSTAENVEITDSKAAKKAALAQMRTETEQSIQRDPERAAAVENTDARQSNSAENVEITDSKAAKKAALAQMRTETEQSIAQAHERGSEYSR